MVKKYPDKLLLAEAFDELELWDIDTCQDWEMLNNLVINNRKDKKEGELMCLQ